MSRIDFNQHYAEKASKGFKIALDGSETYGWDIYYIPSEDTAIAISRNSDGDNSYFGDRLHIIKLVRKGYLTVFPEYAEMFA